MRIFPCAKINLGLNIVSQRPDGYHNLETVFYPVLIKDDLYISYGKDKGCTLEVKGEDIDCDPEKNLVVKAYNLLNNDFDLPPLHFTLTKKIPMQAGMGGGSSDGAYAIRLINEYCYLDLSTEQMEHYAAQLGADCVFFIKSTPAYAEGIGDKLTDIHLDLSDYKLVVIKPTISISTREAFAHITPHQPQKNCRDIVLNQPIETWRQDLKNDFEDSIFPQYPKLAEIKQKFYDFGAIYAAMSGSGSTIFGFFKEYPSPYSLKDYGDVYYMFKT